MNNKLRLLLATKFEIKRSVIHDYIETGKDFITDWRANVAIVGKMIEGQPTYGPHLKYYLALSHTLGTQDLQDNMWLYGDPSTVNLALGILYLTGDIDQALASA